MKAQDIHFNFDCPHHLTSNNHLGGNQMRVLTIQRFLCSFSSPYITTCNAENEAFVSVCFELPSTLQDNTDKMDQTSSRLSWKQ